MNAIIALCHFCEIHGPKPIFCTQTLRDTKLNDLILRKDKRLVRNDQQLQQRQQQPIETDAEIEVEGKVEGGEILNAAKKNYSKSCEACDAFAIGEHSGFFSKDVNGEALFLSSQFPIQPEIEKLLNEAAIRSLSCDTNHLKNGGFAYFGNSISGYVLSHTFHLNDAQARGFFQLYSIVLLMKDKYYLLNAKPFLAEHLRRISGDLRERASISGGDRCKERLARAKSSSMQQHLLNNGLNNQLANRMTMPRSLSTLINNRLVFEELHQQFSWLLKTGAMYLGEYIPKRLEDINYQISTEYLNSSMKFKCTESNLKVSNDFNHLSIRYIRDIVGVEEFPAVCFCILTGIKLIISGRDERVLFALLMAIKRLIPEVMHNTVIALDVNSPTELIANDCRILTTGLQLEEMNDYYQQSMEESIYHIEFPTEQRIDSNKFLQSISNSWNNVSFANKFPELLQKLLKAANESNFNDFVLNKHTNALIEEWQNKAFVWKSICQQRSKNNLAKNQIKKTLGILSKDLPLLDYWAKWSPDKS